MLCSTGNLALPNRSSEGVASGDRLSTWTVRSDATEPRRTVVTGPGLVKWGLPPPPYCLFSQYSGHVRVLGSELLKTVLLKTNCTAPPKPGWGSTGHTDIHLFVSPVGDGRVWKWRSMVAAGNSTGGEEGANE